MEEVKKVFKYAILLFLITLFIGAISLNINMLAFSAGTAVSILAFYSLSIDMHKLSHIKDIKHAKRFVYLSYAKRYALYFIFLSIIGYFGNEAVFLVGALALLSIKTIIVIRGLLNKFFKKGGG